MNKKIIQFLALSHLLMFGIVAFATPIPAEKLFRNMDIHSVTLSPDGAYLATFKRHEDRTSIDFTFTNTMIQHEIISFPYKKSARLLDIEWLDHKTLLIDYKHKNGKERLQAILPIEFKEDGVPHTKAKRIWAKGYIVDKLIDKPGIVLFARDEGRDEYRQKLYYTDYATLMGNKVREKGKPFHTQPFAAYHVFSSHSDKELMSISLDRDNEKVDFHYWIEGMKKWKKAASIDKGNYNFSPVSLINKETLAVLSNQNSDLRGLYEYDLNTQRLGSLIYAHPKYDLISASFSPQTKTLESVSYLDHGQLVSKYFSKSQAELKAKLDKAFSDQQIAIIDNAPLSSISLLATFSSDNPGQYYLFNKNTLKAELVGDSFIDIDRTQLSKAEHISTKNRAGQELESILIRPHSGSNGVLIVNPHGGPVGVRNNEYFDRQIQFLSSRGYSVLQVNFRGSWGFGKEFLEAGLAQFGKAIEEDIDTVVDHVLTKYPYQHVCSMGSSYGGYSSVMLAMEKPDLYKCVIAAFGVYDLPLIFNSRNLDEIDGSMEGIERVLGSMREELWEKSPLYHAEKLQAPILLIAGHNDKIAPIEQSNRFKMRLEQLKKPLETLFYNDSSHGHDNWYSETHHNYYVDDFIRRTLNLPSPYAENDKKSRIEHYKSIADGLDNGTVSDPDSEVAFRNYQEAAKLGHARSQFNIASYYHRGEQVEKDLNQAAHWYQRAADNDYNNANIRLAHLHRRGIIKSASKKKALDFYNKASESDSYTGKIYAARAQCYGEGIEKNIDVCINTLEATVKEKFYKKERDKALMNDVHSIVAEISWRIPLNEDRTNSLKKILAYTKGASIFDAEVDEDDIGIFSKDSNGRYTFEETATQIPLKKGVVFGAMLDISPSPKTSKTLSQLVALKAKWTSPIQHDEDGAKKEPYYYIQFSRYSGGFYFIRELPDDWMQVPGTWTLELATLDGESLFKQEFDLQPESVIRKRQEESGLGSLF
ncbi:prolyl oligopeptidase family serine peptidase [Pseudoteredinibacter isoporae]|uniref:prolyl oligopeptidase family serine peptidase n=1 Tax=Pseudoteredinibacter isoporae TaxID=570281 RepID=UPI003102E734